MPDIYDNPLFPSPTTGTPGQYLADEAAGKTPVEGYLFNYDGVDYALTPNDTSVTMNGIFFVSDAALRDSISQGSDLSGEEITIRVSARSAVALVWDGADFGIPMYLRVYRSFIASSAPNAFVVWEGEVRQITYAGGIATIVAAHVRQNIDRPVPRYTHQSLCNHQLYGPMCRFPRATVEEDWTVVFNGAIPGAIPSLSYIEADRVAAHHPAGYFVGGVIQWTSIATGREHRRIITTAFYTITNRLRFYPMTIFPGGPGVGDTVILVPGCDRQFLTCRDKFNNTENFGGFPFAKERDPSHGVQ